MKVSYLGPTGTYTEEALLLSSAGIELELEPRATIFDAVDAVERGDVSRGFVPFENSIEGSVRATLDAIAFDTSHVQIVGEFDHPIRHNLIAGRERRLDEITVVLSHPQANAQCARFIREQLPEAEVRSIASTSDAVRRVGLSDQPWAALGSAAAARAYGCVVLSEGVEDVADNVTRFVWLSGGDYLPTHAADGGAWRTTLVFSELGDDRPGALVDALTEFSKRDVNLVRIESRPLRRGLGRYLFFIDIEGDVSSGVTAEAVEALRSKAETVRILGSYPLAATAPL
ncbi:MAG: prephenate dehydratase [Solirubrobacterales bacterium]